MSRLDFAPKLKEIEVTDFKKGLGVFAPKPDKPVSFAKLKESLKKAGYTLAAADISVVGNITKDEKGWVIVIQQSGQRFALQGPHVDQALAGAKPGDSIELTGDWKTAGTGSNTQETISPSPRKTAASSRDVSFSVFTKVSFRESPIAETVSASSLYLRWECGSDLAYRTRRFSHGP